jgi:cation transport protein ChaC
MLALERGGQCRGIAYRLPDTGHLEHMGRLLRREIGAWEDVPSVRWIPVETEYGKVQALTFWAGIKGPGHAGKRGLREVAGVLARACGHIGSGAEYLLRTVAKLDELGICDRNLWRLQQLVADEIQRRSTP